MSSNFGQSGGPPGPGDKRGPRGTVLMDAMPDGPAGAPNSQTSPQPTAAPHAQQPYAQQPHAQQPHAQQPYAQQPYAQQPYAQQPYAQQPYAQQPYAQQPPYTVQTPHAHPPPTPAAQYAALVHAPSTQLAATHAPIGEHYPIPPDVKAALPQLPLTQALGPHDAHVTLSGAYSAIECLRHVGTINHRDKDSERRQKKLMAFGIVFAILGVLTLPFFGAGLVPIAIAIYLFIRRHKVAKDDIEDRRLEVLSGTLLSLASELKAKKPVTVDIDFSGYKRHALGNNEYVQRWLSLSLPLQDGATVELQVTLRAKEKLRPKRKYTKTKLRMVEQIAVNVLPPKGKAFRTARAPKPGAAIAGIRLFRASVLPNRASFSWCTPATVQIRTRSGWMETKANQLNSQKLIAAIVASYKLAAKGEHHA